MDSPLLALPGAVAGNGIDAPVAAHYGSPPHEQRFLQAGEGVVDPSPPGGGGGGGPHPPAFFHAPAPQGLEHPPPPGPTTPPVPRPPGPPRHPLPGPGG